MSVVHVASFIVLRTGPEALSFYPWTLLLKCLHSSFAEMREEPVAVIDSIKEYSDSDSDPEEYSRKHKSLT